MPPVWGSWPMWFARVVRWPLAALPLPLAPPSSAVPAPSVPSAMSSRTVMVRRRVVVLPAASVKVCSAIQVPGRLRSMASAGLPALSKRRTGLRLMVRSVRPVPTT